MKSMKIEINAEQPLDEVVKDLERLGYGRDMDCHMGNLYGVIVFGGIGDFNTCDKYQFSRQSSDEFPIITLQQLREMK